MRVKILGSAAGGGFPQWNCACSNCSGFRSGTVHASARSQTQIAFSPESEGKVWFLVCASPDLRAQILAHPELAPRAGAPFHSPIAGVSLPSADVDSVMGLLHLREFQSFFVFSTAGVQRILKKENKIFGVLDRADPPVQWQVLSGKGRLGCHLSESPGEAPAFVCVTMPLDGAFWSDDELIRTGRSKKTACEIGHLPLSGPDGLLEQFPKSAKGRKILIHINNTNPILDEDSAEHRAVLEAGFEIAYDGMEFTL